MISNELIAEYYGYEYSRSYASDIITTRCENEAYLKLGYIRLIERGKGGSFDKNRNYRTKENCKRGFKSHSISGCLRLTWTLRG